MEHLRAQAREVVITGGPITTSDLSVPTGCLRADVPDGVVPVRALAYDPAGQPWGDVMVWVGNG